MMSHFVGGVDLLGDTSPVLFGALMISRIGYLAFGILLLVKRNWKIALTIAAYSAVCLVFEWWVLDDSYSILVLLIAILCTIFLRKQGSFKL